MADTGTLYPGTVTTAAVTPYDDFDWTNPTNVLADDTNYASITDSAFDTGAQSYVMSVRNFGSTVPTDGTITGVQVEIGRYYATGAARDGVVQLINGIGTALGDNLGSLTTTWSTTAPGTMVYGGSANLWGTAITPAIVNGTSFGVQFVGTAAGNNCDAFVDFIRMVVYYNAPTTLWNVTVAEDNQAQKSDLITFSSLVYPIAAADCSQTQVSDAAVLGVWTPITAIDDNQAQVSDLAYINYLLGAAECNQVQTNDAVTLGAIYPVTVTECNQAQVSDAVGVSFSAGVTYTPQTGLLDDFNRADENPLNPANWDGPFAAGQGLWKVVSSQAIPVG